MGYLAVPEMPRRQLFVTLLRQSHWMPQWHAVADTSGPHTKALCGFRYRSEPHRAWDQSTLASRCPQCQRLVLSADGLSASDRPPRAHAPQQWPTHPSV